MLRSSMPATPRNVVDSITASVKPQRWAFNKAMELLHALRNRDPEPDYKGRRNNPAAEQHIKELLSDIRKSLHALCKTGLVGPRLYLEQAFEHCEQDKMGKAAVEFSKARQAALDSSGCVPERESESADKIDGGSRKDNLVVADLEARVEAIRIACVSALYEYENDMDKARQLVVQYMCWMLSSPVIKGQFKVYLNPTQPQAEKDSAVCNDRKRLLAAVCMTNLSLQSFFMKLGMADTLEAWPTIGLKHMKHFYI